MYVSIPTVVMKQPPLSILWELTSAMIERYSDIPYSRAKIAFPHISLLDCQCQTSTILAFMSVTHTYRVQHVFNDASLM